MTTAYLKTIERLDTAAREVDALAAETGLDDRRIAPVIQRLREAPFRVLVLGEFSRGKSTFVNALLRDKVLPSSVRPTTAVISAIRNGPARRAVVHYRDPDREAYSIPLPDEKVAKSLSVLTAKNDQAPAIERVEIEIPVPGLALPLEIIDTPGVNDIDTQREEITYGYLARADAAIMLLDLHQPLSASEQRFLQERVLANDIRKLLFAVNKVDQADVATRNKALAYIERQLQELSRIESPVIVPVAAKPALKAWTSNDHALLESSLFPAFEERLHEFLVEASGTARLTTAQHRVERLAAGLRQALTSLAVDLTGETEQVEARISAARQALEGRRRDLERARLAVDAGASRLQTDGRAAIDRVLQTARGRIGGVTARPEFPSEASVDELRTVLNDAMRGAVEAPRSVADDIASDLLRDHSAQTALVGPRTGAELAVQFDAPAADESSAMVAGGIGGAIGGFIGAALLGPLGAVPLGVFGGWIGSLLAPKPSGAQIEERARAALSRMSHDTRAVLSSAADELRSSLDDALLEPRRAALAAEEQRITALMDSTRAGAADRARRIQQVEAWLDRLGSIERTLAEGVTP